MNNTVRKITLTAMLIALTVICLKIVAYNSGFIRISFGPALIIFSSLYLGPVYGLVVGAGSDIVGAFLISHGQYQPLFTVVYGLLGVLPWLLNFLLKKLKNPAFSAIFFNVLMVLWTAVTLFAVWFYPQIDDLKLKIIYSSVGVALSIGSSLGIFFISKYFKKKFPDYDDRFYRYAIICLVTEIVMMVFANSLVKSVTFDQPYLLMIELMALISFINIPLNTYGSYYLEILMSKIH